MTVIRAERKMDEKRRLASQEKKKEKKKKKKKKEEQVYLMVQIYLLVLRYQITQTFTHIRQISTFSVCLCSSDSSSLKK